MHSHLISPHDGALVDLVVDHERAEELKHLSQDWPSLYLTPRQLCDLEFLANGGFSPFRGFLCRKDYESVCEMTMLADGSIWPIPITLDVPEAVAKSLDTGSMLALRDPEGVMLAALDIEELWQPDLKQEAQQIFGTSNPEHPDVAYLTNNPNPRYAGGKLECLQLPNQYDFRELRLTPRQLRERFTTMEWHRVVAFQTRNPMHRAHQELTFRASRELEANLLIHPVLGLTKPGDVDHYTRVRCYLSILKYYPHNTAVLSLLPLAMRLGGLREAILHALIRKNYRCTHPVVARDLAGQGSDSDGYPFYGPYEAQELFQRHQDELCIQMVPFKMMGYAEDQGEYLPEDEFPKGATVETPSGTELRQRLVEGRDIPLWFSFPEIIKELRRTYPLRSKRGFTVFFTDLSAAGKSTLADVLVVKMLEDGGRPVTLLDGDIVCKNLSSELGFSKEHRDLNIRCIGFVASEIIKNGGITICAPIAPYDSVRKEVRQMIEAVGESGFILIHVATPLEVCEQREPKGVYAEAFARIIKGFTGISDLYEEPTDAELTIDTSEMSPEECSQKIVLYLEKEGYIGPQIVS